MKIIEIKALDNGAHRNQTADFISIPKGWAVIPENVETPNFPFGDITIAEVNGVMTVTKWEAGVIPEPEPEPEVETEPSSDEILNTLLGVTIDE